MLRDVRKRSEYAYLQTYFRAYYVRLRTCTQMESIHYNIKCRPWSRYFFPLDSSQHSDFNGKLHRYFHDVLLSKHDKNRNPIPCWKQKDGDTYCSGSAYESLIYVSLPVFLLFEVLDNADWDFSPQLRLLQNDPDIPGGLQYTLIGRVLSQPEQYHYTVRLRGLHSSSQVYEYDDMFTEKRGFTRLIKGGSVKTHLSGTDSSIKLKKGLGTAFAIYSLEGGVESQESWLKHQLKVLEDDYNIKLSTSDLRSVAQATCTFENPLALETPSSERVWLTEEDNRKIKSRDYVQILPLPKDNDSKRKRKSAPKGEKPLTIKLKQPKQVHHAKSHTNSNAEAITSMGEELEHGVSAPQPEGTQTTSHSLLVRLLYLHSLLLLDHNLLAPVKDRPRSPSPFPLHCRCGVRGNANWIDDGLPAIQCYTCEQWSHVACQRLGRADNLKKGDIFTCDECNGEDILIRRYLSMITHANIVL